MDKAASRASVIVGCLVLIQVPSVGQAHHSRVNFRMDTVVEIQGTITRHEYRNPHTFLTLQTTAESGDTEEWLLEANSVSNLRLGGWEADSFSPGERVTVRGNPDRNTNKRMLFVNVIRKSDGAEFVSAALSPGGSSASATAGSTDFSGVWQPDFASRDIAAGFRRADLPMTPKGQTFLDAFDPLDDPALDCEPDSLPMTLLPIYPVEFTRVGDELHMWYEEFDGRRVVHLGTREHPADAEPTLMGHSVGWFEEGVLVIDTTHFTESRWGLGRGAPSGPQKRVVERYSLADNGKRLDLVYTVEDPEYLTEPVTVSGEMFLKPDYEMRAWDCDPGAARRHLSLD